jgi:hypothetical protein
LETSKVTLQPGRVHRVALAGFGAGGYIWNFVIEGPPGVIDVSLEPAEPPVFPPPGGPPPPTFSRDHTYIITAVKPGKARVMFLLQRPWEQDRPPVREVTLDVSVEPNGH